VPGRRGAKTNAGAEKKLIVGDDEAPGLRLRELSKDIAKVARRACPDDLYLYTHFLNGRESIVGLYVSVRILRIEKKSKYRRCRDRCVQQFQTLVFSPNGHAGHAGHIRSGMIEARDKPNLDWICIDRKHDRSFRGGRFADAA
jgi:hypothetical protein